MKLVRWQIFSTEETLARMRGVRLKGYSSPLIYARSKLSLERAVPTDSLVPAQRYVLKSHINRMSTLASLFSQKGLNLFALEGLLLFWTEKEGRIVGPIPITPPIIEESYENNNLVVWLINDGMHRIAVALKKRFSINIILVKDVPIEWPYYAFPLPGGWADVEALESLPPGYRKKNYRKPDDYKALFRDFNAVFPGIQKERESS